MADYVYELMAKIGLDDAEYKGKLKGAGGLLQSFGNGLKTVAKVGAAAFAAVGAATAAATTALIKGTTEVARYGDNIDKMAQKMNMSTDAYQEWDAVLQHCGTSMEAMQTSMKTLANAAETGNEAFDRLGISQEEIASMSEEQLFERTIAALQDVESETERTYLASKLLGRGSTELGALLNMSAEEVEEMRKRVHELGGVMSEDAIEAAAAYKDSLQDMTTSFEGLKRGLFTDFMPGITEVMNGLTEIFSGNTDEGIGMISKGLDTLGDTIKAALPKLKETGKKIFKALLGAFTEALPELLSMGAEILVQLITGLIEAIPELLAAIPEIFTALVTAFQENWPAIKEAGKKLLEMLGEGLVSAWEWLKEKVVEIVGKIITAVVEKWTEMVTRQQEALQGIRDAIIAKWEEIKGNIAEKVQNIKDAIVEKWEEIKQNVAEKVQAVKDAIAEKVQAFVTAGKELIDGFLEGITNAWNTVVETVTGFFNGIVDTVKGILGVHSPSTVFSEIGSDTIEGYGEGVDEESPSVLEKVSGFASSVIEAAGGIVSGVKEKAGAVGSWVSGLFGWGSEENAAAGEAADEAAAAGGDVKKGFISSLLGTDVDVAGIFEKMKTASQAAMEKLKAAWSEIASALKETLAELTAAFDEALQAMEDRVEATVVKLRAQFKVLEKAAKEVATAIKTAFNFNWSIPRIKTPHLQITWETIEDPEIKKYLGTDKIPNFNVVWYKKAYENPYLFTKPTLMGFGDGAGGEMVYGHENLMSDIKEATGGSSAEVEAKLDQVIDLMENIIRNGLNANISKNQIYRTINTENQKRSRATNYNALAMA